MELLREKVVAKTLCIGDSRRAVTTHAGKSLQHTGDIDIWDNCDYLGSVEVYFCLDDGIKLKFGDDWYGYADVTSLVQAIERTTAEFQLGNAILAEARDRGFDWSISNESSAPPFKLIITDNKKTEELLADDLTRMSTIFVYFPEDKKFKIKLWDDINDQNIKVLPPISYADNYKVIQDDITTLVTDIDADMAAILARFKDIKESFPNNVRFTDHEILNPSLNFDEMAFRYNFTVRASSPTECELGTVDVNYKSKTTTVTLVRTPCVGYNYWGYDYSHGEVHLELYFGELYHKLYKIFCEEP